VIEITILGFSLAVAKASPKPLKFMQIFGVGDADNGWRSAALRCKSLPVAGRDFPWRATRATNRSGRE
jgi:hypothetical protein